MFEDDTQDTAHEEELTSQVKEWICSRDSGTINVSDVLSNFPDISMVINYCSLDFKASDKLIVVH
jgi:hypothetical protein